jgi:Type I phosphodiesterase / nucleotide pyrophosphatase
VPIKVLLVVIDAATPHVVCPAVRTGRLPVLQQLVEAGTMHQASVSIFPSITPAATSSIVTGAYPAEHGIAGASWYDAAREEVAYYGDDFWIIAREGFGAFINDFLLRLNGDRLKAPTLFEMIERAGRSAACLNYLVFRGNHPHRVDMPGLIAALPGVPLTETVEGPSNLALGNFVRGRTSGGKRLDHNGGLLDRFGMDDASTGTLLRDLMGGEGLPDFTVAYFADNDYRSHAVGPVAALPVIERIDRMLGDAFEAAGGIDRVLRDTIVIVTSDHGHCDVLADPAASVIHLERTLGNFRLAELGKGWRARDEVMICPNMRASQIYVREPSPAVIEAIAAAALCDPRVDQVLWRTGPANDRPTHYLAVSARGRLEFWRGSGADSCGVDLLGESWAWRGNAAVLDLAQDGRTVLFDEYPNAFERLAGVLDLPQSGEMWITAKPGCEFEVPGGQAHAGGASHGALHALDSLCPVILAGGPTRLALPRHMRSVDIAPLCMTLLGIPMRYQIGDPRRQP